MCEGSALEKHSERVAKVCIQGLRFLVLNLVWHGAKETFTELLFTAARRPW